MAAAARKEHSIGAPFRIVMISGDHKGEVYELLGDGITIGRAEDNDIILRGDAKCSRHHAKITLTSGGVEVVDLSQKNKIDVNGQLHDRVTLTPGMVFIVGSTQMRLDGPVATQSVPSHDPKPRPGLAVVDSEVTKKLLFPTPPQAPLGLPPLPSTPPISVRPTKPSAGPAPGGGNRALFYGIIIILGLGLWFLFSGTSKKDVELKLGGSVEEQQARLEEMNKRRDEMVKISEKSGTRNPQWRDAQSLYLQGFRDYKKGQYTRAIESFRGSLSIYPGHQLASRYLTLARRKQDELIQSNMSRAREYRERGMYQKCSAHFAMAMTLLGEPSHAQYKESKAGLEECNLHLEGRY